MGPWALRPSYCLLLACIFLLIAHQNTVADPVRPSVVYPFLKVTYKVRYEPVEFVQKVNDTCGRYYAENFLQDFYNLQSNFTALCSHESPHNLVTADVAVNMVAMVHLVKSTVELDIYIFIRANGTHAQTRQMRETILACNHTLEGHFRNIRQFEDESHTFLRTPPGELNCPTMEMRPERLSWATDTWTCPENWEDRGSGFVCSYVGDTESEPANGHSCQAVRACLANFYLQDLIMEQQCAQIHICQAIVDELPLPGRQQCQEAVDDIVFFLELACESTTPIITPTPTATPATIIPTTTPTTTTTTTTTMVSTMPAEANSTENTSLRSTPTADISPSVSFTWDLPSTLASTKNYMSTTTSTLDLPTTTTGTTGLRSTKSSGMETISTAATTTDPTFTMASTTDPVSTMASTTDSASTMASTTDSISTTDTISTIASSTDSISTMASATDSMSTMASTTDPLPTTASTTDAFSTVASTTDPPSSTLDPPTTTTTEGPATETSTFLATMTSGAHMTSTDSHQQPPSTASMTSPDMTSSQPPMTTSHKPRDSTTSRMESSAMTTVAMTTPPPLLPDAWGIQIKNNISFVELVEGGGSEDITLHAWANMSSVCEGMANCQLSVGLRFTHGAAPKCRRQNHSIAQIVVGQPRHFSGADYCSLQLEWYHMNGDLTIPLRARLDGKYDGTQTRMLNISLRRVIDDTILTEVPAVQIKVSVKDRDQKATCSSINDPHLGTFDGLEYNNYFEGEFILYQHKNGLFQANTVYQLCGPGINASCNCAVAVKSGDDVIVIDKCRRITPPFYGLGSTSSNPPTVLTTTIYLNGELTPATKIYEEADGMMIYVYLPMGTYIKVLVNGNFLNVWVVPSASDYQNTAGMCGVYDGEIANDLTFRNHTVLPFELPPDGSRIHPDEFALNWRVDSTESLMVGVPAAQEQYQPPKYCECEMDVIREPHCGFAYDVATCDIYQGTDVTEELLQNSVRTPNFSRRRRRNIDNNVITVPNYPIDINPNFIPQIPVWHDGWTFDKAYSVCQNAIQFSAAGMLCSQLPAVNMDQEILTCVEDIQITANDSWVSSALDAMVQKCLEEIQRNDSIPSDIANSIESQLCVHECNGHGICRNAVCVCQADYAGADCSSSRLEPPDISQLPAYGLCDLQSDRDNCSDVVVFGSNFINSTELTCQLLPVKLVGGQYIPLPGAVNLSGIYINFNEVRCPVPQTMPYLLTVSNDGMTFSNPLLFIPYDSVCNNCSTSTSTCVKLANSCVIDGRCYGEGERSKDGCLRCSPVHNELEWTTVTDEPHCESRVMLSLPDWLVAVIAAVAGSITGVLCGFFMYWCFCKSSCQDKSYRHDDFSMEAENDPDSTPTFDPAIEESILHRNPDLSAFSHPDGYHDRGWSPYEYQDMNYRNDGRGMTENGVNEDSFF